jgi:hypothetical protein
MVYSKLSFIPAHHYRHTQSGIGLWLLASYFINSKLSGLLNLYLKQWDRIKTILIDRWLIDTLVSISAGWTFQ